MASSPKRYTPSVRQAISAMRRGATLESRMVETAYSFRTKTSTMTRYLFLDRSEEPLHHNVENALLSTLGDLIEVESKTGELFNRQTTYRLTERGKTIVWDGGGLEMPEGWTPPPPKPKPFPSSYGVGNVGLMPKANVMVLCRTREQWDDFWKRGNQVEPILQCPSPVDENVWALTKQGKCVLGGTVVRRRSKGKSVWRLEGYVASDTVRTASYLEYDEWAATQGNP